MMNCKYEDRRSSSRIVPCSVPQLSRCCPIHCPTHWLSRLISWGSIIAQYWQDFTGINLLQRYYSSERKIHLRLFIFSEHELWRLTRRECWLDLHLVPAGVKTRKHSLSEDRRNTRLIVFFREDQILVMKEVNMGVWQAPIVSRPSKSCK